MIIIENNKNGEIYMKGHNFLLIIVIALASFNVFGRDLSAKEILKKYKEMIDPENKARKIKTMYTMESVLIHPDEIVGQIETKIDFPKKIKIFTVIPTRKKDIKICSGNRAWGYSQNINRPYRIRDDGINMLKMQIMLNNPDIELKKMFKHIEKDPGVQQDGDKSSYRLMFFDKSNEEGPPKLVIYFDVNTFLPSRLEIHNQTKQGGEHIEMFFENYKNIEGFLVPMRKIIRKRDFEIEKTIDVIEFNVEFDEDEFDIKSLKITK